MFQDRLKKLREARNMTQREAAGLLGIPVRTYASYENNEREPNSEVLILLSKAYGVSTDYLLGIEQYQDLFSLCNDEGYTIYSRLDPIDRAEIRGTMKQMLKSEKYTTQNGTAHHLKDIIGTGKAAAFGGATKTTTLSRENDMVGLKALWNLENESK